MPMAHAFFSCSMMNDFISFPTIIWYIALYTNHSVTGLLVNQQRSHDWASFSKKKVAGLWLLSNKHLSTFWQALSDAALLGHNSCGRPTCLDQAQTGRPGLSWKIGIHEPGQGGRPGLKAGLNRQNIDFTGLKRVVSDYIESYNTYNNMRFYEK